jgi:hypothetical protein
MSGWHRLPESIGFRFHALTMPEVEIRHHDFSRIRLRMVPCFSGLSYLIPSLAANFNFILKYISVETDKKAQGKKRNGDKTGTSDILNIWGVSIISGAGHWSNGGGTGNE